MKTKPMKGILSITGKQIASILAVTALAFLFVTAGCTTSTPAPAPVTTPPVTVQAPVTTQTMVPTATTEDPGIAADRAFASAADGCYEQTPAITNLTQRLTFATCMKNIPLPPGNCAQNYRYYVLRATNEDTTTAGFARETEINRLAREAYRRGEGYDGISLEYVPCGNKTLIPTSFYQ